MSTASKALEYRFWQVSGRTASLVCAGGLPGERARRVGVGWLAVLATLLCCGVEAPAATMFYNSLKDIGASGNDNGADDSSEDTDPEKNTYNNILAAGLDVAYREGDGDSIPRIDFSDAGALFDVGNIGDDGRNYLVTQDKDYHSVDFTASVLFTTTGSGAGSQVMFGVGTGKLGGFSLPDYETGNAAALIELAASGSYKSFLFHDTNEILTDSQEEVFLDDSFFTGTHRLAMVYDASASQITWKLDIGNDTTIDATHSRYVDGTGGGHDVLGDWNNGEDAAIFFGGDDGVVISDFRVTPEPSAALLALLGVLGLLGARCRR